MKRNIDEHKIAGLEIIIVVHGKSIRQKIIKHVVCQLDNGWTWT